MLNYNYDRKNNYYDIVYNTKDGVQRETHKFKPLRVVEDTNGKYTNLEGIQRFKICDGDYKNTHSMYTCLYRDKYKEPDYYLNTVLQLPEETLNKIITPNLIFYDIETNEYASKDYGKDKGRINSIAYIFDGKENVLVKGVDGTEREIIIKFLNYCDHNDVMGLVGFNSKEFDNPVLFNRAKALGIRSPSLNQYTNCNIDVMVLARVFQYVPKGQYISLENLALKLGLPGGKTDTGYYNPVTLYEQALNDPGAMETFKEYNIQDVRLTLECFEAMESEQQLNELFKQTLTPYNKVQYNSVLLNAYTCKEAMKDHKVINEPLNKPIKFKNNGGYNHDIGSDTLEIYNNIGVFDIVSYYPHLLQLIGADPTYEYPNINRTTGEIFKFEYVPNGYLSKLSKDLYESRAKTKQERDKYKPETEEYKRLDFEQQTKKIIVNSLYGVLNQKGNYYILKNELLGATITALGRDLLSHIIETFEGVYGKTDSVFIPLRDGVDPDVLLNALNQEINKFFKDKYNLDNATDNGQLVRFEVDDVLKQFIVKDKNNYVKVSQDGKVKLKGSSFINSRHSEFEGDVTQVILNGVIAGESKDAIVSDVLRFTGNTLKMGKPLDYYSYLLGLSEKQKNNLKHSGRSYMDKHNITYFYGFKYYACRVVGFIQDYIMYPKGYTVKDYILYKPFAYEQAINRLTETKIITKTEATKLKREYNVKKAINRKRDDGQVELHTPIKPRNTW